MIIQYASDLHLEFPKNKKFLRNNPIKPIGDILILSGDIVPFAKLDKHHDFFNYVSDNFENTYWIPGNHEYYYFDLADQQGAFHEKIKDNVHLLNDVVINNSGIDLIFSTLWTQISPSNRWSIERGMNDFHVIKCNNAKLTVEQYNQLHSNSLAFLQSALSKKANRALVATHHMPTFYNYPEKYKESLLNEAFAVELYDLIEANGPDCWIHGHTHGNTNDFTIGDTKIVSNQLGYVSLDEHHDYRNAAVLVV